MIRISHWYANLLAVRYHEPMRKACSFIIVASLGVAVFAPWGVGCVPEPTPEPDLRYRIDVSAPVTTVSKRYVSVAVDIAQVVGSVFWDPSGERELGAGTFGVDPYDFSRPRLRTLAAELAPAILRIGGSESDRVYYDLTTDPVTTPPTEDLSVLDRTMWDGIHEFAAALDYQVMFTLNGGPEPRDAAGAWVPDQARALMAYTNAQGYEVEIWELTNEPNGLAVIHDGFELSGEQLAADYVTLHDLLRELDPDAKLGGPSSAYWPTLGEPLAPVMPAFMPEAGPLLDLVSWHYYPQQSRRCPVAVRRAESGLMLEPKHLAEFDVWAQELETARATHAPQARVWLGETGGAQCGGEPGISDRFESGFWWLDQLGRAAQWGQPVVVRQTLSGSEYGLLDDTDLEPRPDYFNSVLWKRFMGTRVLAIVPEDPAPDVRVYAHCAPGGASAVGIVAINLSANRTYDVAVNVDGALAADGYAATATALSSPHLLLNGTELTTDADGRFELPPRQGFLTGPEGVQISLSPHSYAFVTARGSNLPACR